MKKTAENRYPNSATLFRFCKEALELRYDGNVKVIDQDVGSILGYDPADCSHWKKGKKNIHSLGILRSIADHLSLDERLLIDIAAGKMNLDEALFEFKGYGAFALQGTVLESLKKEFFKNPGKWQRDNGTITFEELFDIDRGGIVAVAEWVLQEGRFTEAPIYIPEVYQLFAQAQVEKDATLKEAFTVHEEGEGASYRVTIKYRDADLRPYMRFLAAKQLFHCLCQTHRETAGKFANRPSEVKDIQGNIFAGALLVPAKLLREEVERLDSATDIVTQLAETFWVSKALMNQRLRDYMEFRL